MNTYGNTQKLTGGICFSILFLMYRRRVNFLFHYELVLIPSEQSQCHLSMKLVIWKVAAIIIYSWFYSVLMFLTLQASEGNTVIDYKDWQIPLGRRFRWFLGYFPLETFSLFLSLYLYIDIFVFGIEISLLLVELFCTRECSCISSSGHINPLYSCIWALTHLCLKVLIRGMLIIPFTIALNLLETMKSG